MFQPKTYQEALAKVNSRKLRKPLKRSKLPVKRVKKPKLKSISTLKKTLWKLVSEFIRERDFYLCRTCGRHGAGSQIHAGHFIPNASGGALLRYHPENIYAQCYHCNINLGGDGANYYRILELQYGQDLIKKLFNLKLHSIQADRYFYDSLINLYKNRNQEEIVKFLESYL